MKLLTLNFLTCAIKDCKAAATATTTTTTTTTERPRTHKPARSASDPHQIDQEPDLESEETEPQHKRGPSFPLAISDATLESTELEFQPLFWRNIIPRIEWDAMREIVGSVSLTLPEAVVKALLPEPEREQGVEERMEGVESTGGAQLLPVEAEEGSVFDDDTLRALHRLLLETQVAEGALVCRRCGHRYAIKEGIANFLLPPHLV